jgi:hypothetical protein
MKKLIGLVLIASALSGCGYDGWVRYECQEYENWQKPECTPPQCKVTGTCTDEILGNTTSTKK